MNQRPLRREARRCHYSAISGGGTSLLDHLVKESATERGADRLAIVGLDNTEAANLASPADHYRQVCQLSRGTCAETLMIADGPVAPFDRIGLQDNSNADLRNPSQIVQFQSLGGSNE